jgi:hypothetical protein
MMLIEPFVARYNGFVWYFRYCGAGKLLPRVANHLRGCWARGVLPRGCSRVIPLGSSLMRLLGPASGCLYQGFAT